MDVLKSRLSKFKQEALPILFCSVLNTWFLMKFPVFMKLGAVSGPIITLLNCMLGIFCIVILFTFADVFAGLFNFNSEALDLLPFGNVIKIFNKVMYIVILPCAYAFVWYKDFYHQPTIFYVLTCIFSILFLVLWLRAVSRESLQQL
jgi:hypothetical protein